MKLKHDSKNGEIQNLQWLDAIIYGISETDCKIPGIHHTYIQVYKVYAYIQIYKKLEQGLTFFKECTASGINC